MSGQVGPGGSGGSGSRVSGSGTANTIAKFTSSTTVGNSRITDDGSNPVTVTGNNPNAVILEAIAPTGAENTGNTLVRVTGEEGRALLALDPYGELALTGAVVDPTNGGAILRINNAAAASVFILAADIGDGTYSATLGLSGMGSIKMPTLPTSDPSVAGQLWNSLGVLMISNG